MKLSLAESLSRKKETVIKPATGYCNFANSNAVFHFSLSLSDLPTVYDFDLGLAGLWEMVEQDLVIFFINFDLKHFFAQEVTLC